MDNKNTIRANLAVTIVVAIITAIGVVVGAAIAYHASTYEARHPQYDLKAGSTTYITFEASAG